MPHAHGLSPTHDLEMMVLSVVVAILASYTALTLSGRVASSRSTARAAWLLGGSASMGIGIWSMHFIGLLAFRLPVPVRYDVAYLALSLLVAIAASALALFIVHRERVRLLTFVAGAVAMGGAIAGMHYIGMHGMLVPLRLTYWPPLVVLSIVIAVIASGAALRIAHGLRTPAAPWALRVISPIVMGFAISGMHYTGIAAAQFTPGEPHHDYAALWEVGAHQLHWPVILGSIFILTLTLITAAEDSRFQLQRRRALEAEHALRTSEERFRAIVESSQGWIWETDPAGVVTYSNPASSIVLGVAPGDLVGGDRLARVHADDRPSAQACLRTAVTERGGWKNVVLRWQTPDGLLRYLESNATPILDEEGQLVGFRGADRDITDRKQAEVMKSDFVSFVSHQLRTPLSGVSWMLELAAEAPGLTPEVSGYIAEARESAHRLIRLVNDLLDVSRLESGRLVVNAEHLQMEAVVASVAAELRPLAAEKSLRLSVDGRRTPAVFADAQLVRQAVTNLLSNAIKYTPAGGSIEVTVQGQHGSVTCAFRDSGIGVPKDAQARLFEKFYRADNAVVVESEGTGLGLHLVRLVADYFGGRVWCESDLGKGSLFTLELPAAAAPAERGDAAPLAAATPF